MSEKTTPEAGPVTLEGLATAQQITERVLEAIGTTMQDHEARLRKLEDLQAPAPGTGPPDPDRAGAAA